MLQCQDCSKHTLSSMFQSLTNGIRPSANKRKKNAAFPRNPLLQQQSSALQALQQQVEAIRHEIHKVVPLDQAVHAV